MKNQKGITITSLIIYIVVMIFVFIILTRVVFYFQNNIKDVADIEFETQIDKFNLYFLKEVKTKNNEVEEISEDKHSITFKTGTVFKFENNKIYVNDVKICEDVVECEFLQDIVNSKIIQITIQISQTIKTLEYVMLNTTAQEGVNEAEYTYSFFDKQSITQTNSITIENTIGRTVENYRIYGQCLQTGTPTPSNPIEVQCVGDLVTDTLDENYGKYKIPVICSNADGSITQTVNIYLDEPLRQIKYYTKTNIDYIDFKEQAVIRNVAKLNVTGEENWAKNQAKTDGEYITIRLFSIAAFNNRADIYGGLFSNKFQHLHALWNNGASTYSWRFCFNTYPTDTVVNASVDNETLNITSEDTEATRTEKFKEYISNNNFYIYYPLKTSEPIPVTLPSLPSYYGKTTYTVGTTTAPSNLEVTVTVNDI